MNLLACMVVSFCCCMRLGTHWLFNPIKRIEIEIHKKMGLLFFVFLRYYCFWSHANQIAVKSGICEVFFWSLISAVQIFKMQRILVKKSPILFNFGRVPKNRRPIVPMQKIVFFETGYYCQTTVQYLAAGSPF